MSKCKRVLLVILTVLTAFGFCFAAACAKGSTKYTVTFMDGAVEYKVVSVEKGKRIEYYPAAPARTDENFIFDGWYKDADGKTVWNGETERVTKDIKLYSKFLYVSGEPGNSAMENVPFSNTVTWLQRGLEANAEFTVELFKGRKISETDYDYAKEGVTVNGTVATEQYNGIDGVSLVKWTPDEKPDGGVYAAEVGFGSAKVRFVGLFFKGAGTQENPYLISTATDFAAINTADIPQENHYKLNNDITVRCSFNKIKGHTFNGYLDGNGRTVTLEASDCGLFSVLGNFAVIDELNVDGTILNAVDCTGAIAGVNNGHINYCTVSADVTSDRGTVNVFEGDADGMTGGAGGYVGINNGKIKSSEYSGTVKARVGGGGFAAINNGTLERCTNRGTLGAANAIESGDSTRAFSFMGGIAGINYGMITASATTGSGKLLAQRSRKGGGYNDNIGGITGLNQVGATVTQCYFDGTRVYGNKNVGGIAGVNHGTVSYSFAAGTYRSSLNIKDGDNDIYLGQSYIGGNENVGGIAGGGNGTVNNCFVTANVYAYSGDAYKVASTAQNSVYLQENLSSRDFTIISGNARVKTVAKALITPTGDGNVSVEVESSDKTTATYKLSTNYLQTLNGGENVFEDANGVVRLEWEAHPDIRERFISVKVEGAGGNEFTLSNKESVKYTPEADDKTDAYVTGFSFVDGGEVVFEYGVALGYGDLVDYGAEIVLYPVFANGIRPQSTTLNVAVWTRYVNEQTVSELLTAFEDYDGFIDGWSVKYKTLSSGNNNTFVSDFRLGNEGKFNVGFAYKSKDINFGQSTFVTVRMYNERESKYDDLRVGLISADDIVTKFGEFLATDTAKKIMNPEYVSEAEADKITITFMNGAAQVGTVTVSNATDATAKSVPTVSVGEGEAFTGWSLTDGGEVAFDKNTVSFADATALATGNALTLYAVIDTSGEILPKIKVAVYKKFIDQEIATALENAYKAYCDVNDITYGSIQVLLMTDGNGEAFMNDAADCDVVLGHKGGTSFVAKESTTISILMNASNGGKVANDRKAERLTDNALAVEFMKFLKTDPAKKSMDPSYVTEEEADKITITFMNGETQVGTVTVSNATEATAKSVPAVSVGEGETFTGWSLTDGGEVVFDKSTVSFADVSALATGNALTLYAVIDTSGVVLPNIKVAVYKKFIDQEVATALEVAFKAYCEENKIAYGSIQVLLMTTGDGATFTNDASDCDVALGHKAKTSFAAKESTIVSMMMNAANGGTVADDRKAERLTENELAIKFMEFLKTDEGKAALVTPTEA